MIHKLQIGLIPRFFRFKNVSIIWKMKKRKLVQKNSSFRLHHQIFLQKMTQKIEKMKSVNPCVKTVTARGRAWNMMKKDTDFVLELLSYCIENSIQRLCVSFCVGGDPPTTFWWISFKNQIKRILPNKKNAPIFTWNTTYLWSLFNWNTDKATVFISVWPTGH